MPSLDPGFSVAPGDPGAISQAAAWHQDLADSLELHEATIRGAAGALMSTWDGEAALAYGSLSETVAGHFAFAALGSRDAAGVLRRWAAELDRCQQEGARALHEAEHWLTEQNRWQKRLDDANRRIHDAQGKIRDAQATLSNPLMSAGPFASAFTGPAHAELAAGEQELTRAQADQRTATRELHHAQQQVILWQRRGRQAWDDAITAAEQATGAVGGIEVPTPPLAGFAAPDAVLPPASVHHHGGGFFSDPLGTISHVLHSGVDDVGNGFGWAWNHAPGVLATGGTVLLRGAATVFSTTQPGQILQIGSRLTGRTLGVCAGGDVTLPQGPSGTGSVCYVSAPDGTNGITLTAGGGAGAGPAVSGSLGSVISNGKTLAAQGKGFNYVGATAGEGEVSGGANVSWGTYRGQRVVDYNPVWSPGGEEFGFSVHGGKSYTWTFGSY